MLMRKSIYSRKKSTLIAILAALAICGTLSVSAADSTEEPVGDTLDLTTSDTTHKNKVTNTGKSKNDTIAIGFDNTAANGGLAIGSNNTVSNAARMHLATAIGRNNTANNDSVVVGHSNYGVGGSAVFGFNNYGSSYATVLGLNSKAAGGIAIGNGARAGAFQISDKPTTSTMINFTTAIGNGAVSLNGTSIGYLAKSNLEGLALGSETTALYGGTALGSGASTAENTYSIFHADGVALGDGAVANRSYGAYGYVPLSDTAATLKTEDSMANDLALAKQMGDSVLTAVQGFYDKYGEDAYKEWKSLASEYEKADLAFNKKRVTMEETTYASEADRQKDYNELQVLEKQTSAAQKALSNFEKQHSGIKNAIRLKEHTLSPFKANGSAVSIGRSAVIAADGSVVTRAITRQITNLAAGTEDTDAVNVAQLKQVKTYADGIANTVKELTDKVASGSRDFAGDDKSKVSVKVGETMEITGGAATNNLSDDNIGVVAKGENGVSIKLSKDLKGLNTAEFNTSITVGTGDNKTVITGDSIRTGNTTINNNGLTINNSDPTKNITIQDGNINMGGNAIHNVGEATEADDAINKGQFDRTINNIGNGMNEMNGRINQIGRDVNRVGAGAAALASLHPLDFDPDDKASFAVGFGSYKSEHATALGAFYRPNENTMVNLAATIGNSDDMYSAGVSFKIGPASPYAHMSKSEMAVKLEELTAQNQKIESQNQELNERLAKLEALVAAK
mgnify:FL=1